MNDKIAIFPGSFDPFTKGHEDIVLRGAELFEKLVICIGVNTSKSRHFSVDYMIEKINETFQDHKNIEVISFDGLTANFAKTLNAKYILRGLRNTTDFEYENTIAQANNHINSDLETIFLITNPSLSHISSTITREIHKHKGDVTHFLPYQL